jgi:hypothetical protein
MPIYTQNESLEEEVDHVIEEGRMVLPGIQALFGFQLIAVFNQRFAEVLPPTGRVLHLIALVLVAIAIAIIMAPAAYHRQAERGMVSRHLADFGSRVIAMAMLPLLLAISMDVALVAYAILGRVWISVACGAPVGVFFVWLWVIYPALNRRSHR